MFLPLPTYLRTLRKGTALTQRELGMLLGGTTSSEVSKYELLKRVPQVPQLIGIEIVFKEPIRQVYPVLYARTGAGVLHRAQLLIEEIRKETETALTRAKIAFLQALIDRLASDNETI